MQSQFNAANPAPGVKVYPVPRPMQQVSAMVRRAARTPLTNYRGEIVGVFKPHMSGGGQTLGIPSTARLLGNKILAKGSRSKISGVHRKSAGANPAFQGKIKPQWAYDLEAGKSKLAVLKRMHWSILSYKGHNPDPRFEANYERLRESFVKLHGYELGRELVAMEKAHFDSRKEN